MEPTNNNNQNVTAASEDAAKPAEPVVTKTTGQAATPPPKTPPPKPVHSKASGRGLGWLALLIGAAALGLSAWQWYGTQQAESSTQARLDSQLTELSAAQRQAQSATEQRLQGLPAAEQWQQQQHLLADLQRSQQALSQRLDTLQGDARVDWKLAEAEYMLRLASMRLLAAQDVASAREMLGAVDHILMTQPDSGVFAIREQLARYQVQLEALPLIDRSGLFLKLAALHDQVDQLVALPVPVFDPNEVTPEEEYEDRLARRTRVERVLMRLERYVRVDFQRGKVITPLLDEAEMRRIRRTLQLTLEQAQWAALHGEGEVYRTSLERAAGMLEQFFELDNPQVQAMQTRLLALADERVAVAPPDLAPLQQGLAAYIQSRKVPVSEGESPDE